MEGGSPVVVSGASGGGGGGGEQDGAGGSSGVTEWVQGGVRFLEIAGLGLEARKKAISEFRVTTLDTPSRFVRPQSIHFVDDGKARRWDMVASFPSVAILIYHTGLDAVLMVRQFRPAVFASACAWAAAERAQQPLGGGAGEQVEPALDLCKSGVALDSAFTYELCAGLVDKPGKSLRQIAKEEVAEETGYEVEEDSLTTIATALSAVGISGNVQTLFFVQVDESQRVLSGGGNEHEGEAIDVVALPTSEIDKFLASDTLPKSPGALFALAWFKLQRQQASAAAAVG